MHNIIRKTAQLLSHHAAQRYLKLSWSQAYLFKALHCYCPFPPVPDYFPVFLSYFPLSDRHTLDSIHNMRSCKRKYCSTSTEMAGLLASLVGYDGPTAAFLLFNILFAYWYLIYTLKMCNWLGVSCCLTLKWPRRQVSKVSVLQTPILKKSGIYICFGWLFKYREWKKQDHDFCHSLASLRLLLPIYKMWCSIYQRFNESCQRTTAIKITFFIFCVRKLRFSWLVCKILIYFITYWVSRCVYITMSGLLWATGSDRAGKWTECNRKRSHFY